jgi:hypothetical protein
VLIKVWEWNLKKKTKYNGGMEKIGAIDKKKTTCEAPYQFSTCSFRFCSGL